MKKCKIENCDKKHHGHGYCHNHMEKLMKEGALQRRIWNKVCLVEDCTSKHYCNGYCIKHYQRDKKGLPQNLEYGTKNEYLRGNLNFIHKSVGSWSAACKQFFEDKCIICNWNEAPCDAHHILPKSKKGKNSLTNCAILCPSHHKLADIKKLNSDTLIELVNKLIEDKCKELRGE